MAEDETPIVTDQIEPAPAGGSLRAALARMPALGIGVLAIGAILGTTIVALTLLGSAADGNPTVSLTLTPPARGPLETAAPGHTLSFVDSRAVGGNLVVDGRRLSDDLGQRRGAAMDGGDQARRSRDTVGVAAAPHLGKARALGHGHREVVPHDGKVDDGLEQAALGGEVGVDGLGGHARRRGDVTHACRGPALGDELLVGGGDQRATGLGGLACSQRRSVAAPSRR